MTMFAVVGVSHRVSPVSLALSLCVSLFRSKSRRSPRREVIMRVCYVLDEAVQIRQQTRCLQVSDRSVVAARYGGRDEG
jgi:hypothetical protein